MKNIIYTIICICFLFSCKGNNDSESDYEDEGDVNYENVESNENNVLNGDYCAKIDYYNPETGTRNTYTLPIEVEDGYLTKIQWSNSGWLDNSHFTEPKFDGDETSFIDHRGRKYTVHVIGQGGCGYSSYINPEYDDKKAIEKKENETCPVCYGSKSSYEEICYFCRSRIEREENEKREEQEYKCPRCGSRKFSKMDDYCSSCEREIKRQYLE